MKRNLEGSDVSELPARFPKGIWLPIEYQLLSMQLRVYITVNGKNVLATLDTGASITTVSHEMASYLALQKGSNTRTGVATDAHGNKLSFESRIMNTLDVGTLHFENLNVFVTESDPDLFLLGNDFLANYDLFIAADEGLVGLFAAGTAPHLAGSVAVDIYNENRQLGILANAPSNEGAPVPFQFIVDTGATGSSVSILLGINEGLPADHRYEATSIAVGGSQNERGRFLLDPLQLGHKQKAKIGKLVASGSNEDKGLLGNDVLMRYYTIISSKDAELRFLPLPWRKNQRMTGPGNKECKDESGERVPCVEIALREVPRVPENAIPGICLEAKVHKAYVGKSIELSVVAYSNQRETLFNGGAIHLYFSVAEEGRAACFPLWKTFSLLGVDKDSELSLRFVRTEGIQWPCDPMSTTCMSFTGPVPNLGVRNGL